MNSLLRPKASALFALAAALPATVPGESGEAISRQDISLEQYGAAEALYERALAVLRFTETAALANDREMADARRAMARTGILQEERDALDGRLRALCAYQLELNAKRRDALAMIQAEETLDGNRPATNTADAKPDADLTGISNLGAAPAKPVLKPGTPPTASTHPSASEAPAPLRTSPPPSAPSVPADAESAVIPADASDAHLNVMTPDADHVIELDPHLLAAPAPTTSNPFVDLYQPPAMPHELELVVSAAVPGPQPTAIINDETYGIGDHLKDLTVYQIDADTVFLRKESFLLACPVSERPIKLRFP